MPRHAPIALFPLAAVTALAPAALAQTAQPFVLDPILVERRDEFFGAADRATAVYVSDAELERARIGDLKDVFAGVASVSVGGGIPIAQKIFVNGVDMLNLGVTVDGVPQNNRAFHHVTANAIDPGLLKSVRVDSGVAAADAGPNALAGAVVFETIDAADFLDPGQLFGGNLRFGYDTNGETFSQAITLAGQSDGFEILGYAKSAKGEDYEAGDGETIPGTAADLQSLLLKAAYEAPEGHRLEFSAQQLVDDAIRPFRANFGGLNGTTETRRYDTARRSFGLNYENTQAAGLWDPRVALGYSESIIDVPEPWGSEGTSSALSGKIENRFHLSEVDTVTAGIDLYDRLGRYEGTGVSGLEETAQNLGAYAQARLEPTDLLTLSFGARADWQSFEGVNGYEDDVSGLSGNVSAGYEVVPGLTLRAGYSNVFGGIAIEDNYTFEAFDRPGAYDGLEPSRAENVVVGADWVGDRLTFGIELFRTRIDDARSGTGNFDFESEGFNVAAGYGWNGGYARLTYSNAEVTVDGTVASSYDALDFGAPLGEVIAFEVQHTFDRLPLTVGGSADFALDYDDVTERADRGLDGYHAVNVFTQWMPERLPGLTLRAEVRNLFDEDYADRATYGADFATIQPLKEPGRSLEISASYRF